jgi:hypothetical protein
LKRCGITWDHWQRVAPYCDATAHAAVLEREERHRVELDKLIS